MNEEYIYHLQINKIINQTLLCLPEHRNDVQTEKKVNCIFLVTKRHSSQKKINKSSCTLNVWDSQSYFLMESIDDLCLM